ncbi:hypothetical protein ACFLZZ_01215 [Nanoarchaeota archaeon]
MEKRKISGQMYFFLGVVITYLILLLANKDLFMKSIKTSISIILEIIPVFVFVIILMTLAGYFLTAEVITNFSKKKGIKKWVLMSFSGVFSTGPPYLWYPFLKDLREKGLGRGLIGTFLYSRAVVIAFLPLMIFYFSLKFVIAFYIAILISSLIQGKILERIFD